MSALWIVLVLFLLGMIPVGVWVSYNDGELLVKAAAGPVRFKVYPSKPAHGKKLARQHAKKLEKERRARQKKAEKKRKKKKRRGKADENSKERRSPKKKISLEELLPMAKLALQVIGRLPRKLLLRELRLYAVCGGGDAAKAAAGYGRAWAILGSAVPALEKCFRIQKLDAGVTLDYGRESLGIDARLDIRMRIGTAVLLALGAGVKFLVILVKNKIKHKKSCKGGAAA